MRWTWKRCFVAALLALCGIAAGMPEAAAHGERAQEPFLRTRTLHWYDVTWSTDKMNVNDEIVVSGKVRVYDDWPVNIPEPSTVHLGNATPGPVFVRKASYIDGVPMIQSAGLELNREYDFRIVLQARVPGHHHVHPMINVKDAGGLVGPGKWIEVGGAWEDFKYPVTTLTGAKIDNLETFGVGNVVFWHGIWAVLAAFWLLWWVLRPMLLPRNILVRAGGFENLLVTRTDKIVGAGLLVATIAVVTAGYYWAEATYPRTIPLQAGRAKIEVPPPPEDKIKVKIERATYDVPGRSMKMALRVTNNLDHPVQLGEFATANLRFVDFGLAPAAASVSPTYPKDLVARNGLKIDDNTPLNPGESRAIKVEATDVAWEVERLTSFINDPDSRFGALLFFYDNQQARHIATIGGPIVPTFVR
ncbi:MAG TPA: bacterial ammonia monooxygenase, subunit AmoB [Stellaceae bacterium]|nr:bacterial ammonia monooxygenase, subunit AmoB [Stellaceae bacterium]